MKKMFLIPLMTLVTCVMAWGDDAHVFDIASLKSAVANSTIETIYFDADIEYSSETVGGQINILRSVTIDGQGHTLKGKGKRTSSGNYNVISINNGGTTFVDVTIKNLNIVATAATGYSNRPLETRGYIRSLTLINDSIYAEKAGNKQIITIGGSQNSNAIMTIKDCVIGIGNQGYGMIIFNPLTLDMQNSEINAWCSFYFKGQWDPINNSSNSCHGAVNTEIVAENCLFNNPGICGYSNSFGAFVLEDDGIDMTLKNCVVKTPSNCTDATQVVYRLSSWKKYIDKNLTSKTSGVPCTLTIEGSNSHIQGDFIEYSWDVEDLDTIPVNFYLKGGSYYGSDFEAAMTNTHVSIPAGYHAEKVNQGGQDIYRIAKDAATHTETDPVTGDPVEVLYDLNDAVETTDKGENPATSFELSSGADMTLDNEVTTAGYVQIKDNATEGATTVTVGQTTGGENQTLIINEGLDVQGNSQVVVETGATLQIGEGGIVTEKPENIVIEADENGAASLIMDPAITVNQTPNLTVKMQAKQIGWLDFVGEKYYFWHRFALPIQEASTWVKTPNKPTYVFGWSYTANDWEQLSALTQMKPFKGYTLSADYENLGDVEYTFKGQLAGNTNNPLEFQRNGFNFFGNSYTGYIDILALVDQIMGDNKIDGSVWVWGSDQNYHAVPLQTLRDGGDVYATEIAPMQTFIMKQNGGENATAQLNYEAAVWNNPRYGNAPTPAPARALATDETTHMRIIVTADNGKSDFVMFTEEDRFSDAYEKGYDAVKYMNERAINMYSTIDGEDYSNVATDNLMGKKLNIQTVNTLNYTISFAKVSGEEYALRDNVTGSVVAIEEGVTYAFSAQPNATIGGRFEIVGRNMVVTGVENIENNADAKGIYTVLGQYVGEDFNALPAGMYIVNGVKIIK